MLQLYVVTLLYPSGRYSDDGKWYSTEREDDIEAESLEEAKSMAEKKLADKEYDAQITLMDVDDSHPIPPYISSVKLWEDNRSDD